MFLCPLCGVHSEPSLGKYLKHVRLIHADDPNFSISCSFQSCRRPPFKKFTTYRNHIYAYHNDFSGQQLDDDDDDDDDPIDPIDNTDDRHRDLGDDDGVSNDGGGSNDEDPGLDPTDASRTSISRAAAIWLLKVREKYLLPQSTIENIIEDIDTLYQVYIYYIPDYYIHYKYIIYTFL